MTFSCNKIFEQNCLNILCPCYPYLRFLFPSHVILLSLLLQYAHAYVEHLIFFLVEDVSENIPPYHFNESILKEQALCSSYTKLKAVYDVQSETLRRTNSSPPIRTTRFTNSHTGCPINNIPEVLHPLNQDEYNEGYDRAKFLYDRICKQLPAITTNTSEEEPTTYV